MDLLQLRYFQVAARHESITQAAKELYISQPALSKMIQNLESELQIQLFDRQGRRIILNKLGKRFLKRVNTAINSLEQGVDEIREMVEEKIEVITLYVRVGSMVLPDMLLKYKEKAPHVRFQLQQHNNNLNNRADFYDFSLTSKQIEGHEHRLLLEEEILIAVPMSHPLSGCSSIQLAQLEKEKFIALTPGTALRTTLDSFFLKHEFQPDIVYESDDPAMVRGLIQTGIGISFIPSILWKNIDTSALKLLRLNDHILTRKIYLSWPQDQRLTLEEEKFLDFACSFFNE